MNTITDRCTHHPLQQYINAIFAFTDMDLVNSLVHNLCPHSTLFPSIYTEFNSVQTSSSKLHSAFPGYPRDVIDQIPPCFWGAPSLVGEIDIELGGLVGAEAV